MTAAPEGTVAFNHPVDNVSELEHERHIALAFRTKNLDEKSLGEKTKSPEPTELVSDFAEYVLDNVEGGLTAENLSCEQLGIDPKFVQVLVLREAHNICFTRLGKCIKNNPDIAQTIGYKPNETVHSGSRFNQKAIKIEQQDVPGSQDQTFRDLLENAATRIVWGAVRSGIVLPKRTIKKYDIKLSYNKAIEQLSRDTERAGLHTIIKFLLDKTSDPFEFYRESNKSQAYLRYIAVFAMAAYGDAGLSNAWKNLPSSSDLDAPTNYFENIRKEPDQKQRFKNSSPTELKTQFSEAILNQLELVNNLGMIGDGITIAQDPTLVKSELEDSELTIGSGNTQMWYFPISAGVETHCRLAVHIDLFSSKDQTHNKFEDILTKIDKNIGVKNLYLDGEYDSAQVIEACKHIVSNHWLIATGQNPNRDGWPAEAELPKPQDPPRWFEVTVGEHNVNLVTLGRYGKESQKKMFLTNISKEGMNKDDILAKINRRQAIEETIKEIKEFTPNLQVEERKIQYYQMGMATYLYNIYVMTKMLYTPKYQLKLTPNKNQVLITLAEVCGGDYPKYNDGVK